MTRVYVPLTLPLLRRALLADEIRPAGGLVFAVTSSLRAEYPGADEEELEYLAMADAARAALRLLAGSGAGGHQAGVAPGASDGGADGVGVDGGDGRAGEPSPFLRVVAAVDVDAITERGDRDRCAARVAGPVPWRHVASVHVDGADAADTVRAAADAVDAADLGDLDADFLVGAAEDVDLAWYAPAEIRYLIEDLDSAG